VKRGYVRGNDHCPLPWSKRLQGHETATADTAAEIVRHSDCVAYLPRLVLGLEHNRVTLTEIAVSGWSNHRSAVYLAANVDRVKDLQLRRLKALVQQSLS
jgi:hypothetical protein